MASSIASAFSLFSKTIQQNWDSNSSMKSNVCLFLFITSKEKRVPNVWDWVVDSENMVGGSGFKDKHVWQLSTHSLILVLDPGQ